MFCDLSQDCLEFVVRSTYDSDLQRAKISFGNIVISNTASDHLTILRVNRTEEKPCVIRRMFCKLDDSRKSIATLALS